MLLPEHLESRLNNEPEDVFFLSKLEQEGIATERRVSREATATHANLELGAVVEIGRIANKVNNVPKNVLTLNWKAIAEGEGDQRNAHTQILIAAVV